MENLIENFATIVQAIGLILGGASLIAGLTPTPKDDAFIRKAIERLSFLTPKDRPGTFKWPFQK